MRAVAAALLTSWLFCSAVAAADSPASLEELVRKVKPAVVKITQMDRSGDEGIGAGCLIAPDLIATNAHVIGQGRPLLIETESGKKLRFLGVEARDVTLDLAVLRVEKTELKPLVLGASGKLQQGQRVVAMGSPMGLGFSVVDGLLSGTRDIEGHGKGLLQIALPIERGNSGGPLMDVQGRLLGLLTLKSMRTENLGFAVPVDALKELLAKPSPITAERWVRIGKLDPVLWKPVMGGGWTRHSGGRLKAESLGEGFGGRGLCLWQPEMPGESYELRVSVKLEDESGAAGLAFCADGGDGHYGFYPSAGQMRFTRFEGPSVGDWSILEQKPVSSYHAGQWNELRVVVTPAGVRAWVNGELVVESVDTALRGGRVGLCKFRNTVAEFRGFQLRKLAKDSVKQGAEQVALVREIDQFLAHKKERAAALEQLLTAPLSAQDELNARASELQKQAALLREMATQVHQESVMEELVKTVAAEGSLTEAALLLARYDQPELDTRAYVAVLEEMARELRADPEIQKGGRAAVQRLSDYLFKEGGFHVPTGEDYAAEANSYLSDVLDDRAGLPIMLSVLYLDLAQRCGMKGLFGSSLPLRFMVGWQADPEGEILLVDVSQQGRIITPEEVANDLEIADVAELRYALEPASEKDIILRMVNNLTAGVRNGEVEVTAKSAGHLSLQIALSESAPRERILRAGYRQKMGDKAGAREDIGWILHHPPEGLNPLMVEQLQNLYQSLE